MELKLQVRVDPKWGYGRGYSIKIRSNLGGQIVKSSRFAIVKQNAIVLEKLMKQQFVVGDEIRIAWTYDGWIDFVDIEMLNNGGVSKFG